MISNWQEAKARSTYHFNKWHKDTDIVQHLGKFTGGWQTEVQAVINDAKALNWSNRREGTGRPDGDVEAEENASVFTVLTTCITLPFICGDLLPLVSVIASTFKLLIILPTFHHYLQSM